VDVDEEAGESGEVDEYKSWPCDVAIDDTKEKLGQFFEGNRDGVYYDQQLRVLFEERPYKVYQWITGKALTELREEGKLRPTVLDLDTGEEVPEFVGLRSRRVIRFFWHPRKRSWRQRAKRIVKLVQQFSTPEFAHGLGHQGEVLADLALLNVGFRVEGRKVRSWKGRMWRRSGHDLDRVYSGDGVLYGAEIKNTLGYIPKDELLIKMEMCKQLRLRPLVIARSLPTHYVHLLYRAGGLGWIIGVQSWPFAQEKLAEVVRRELGFRISCAQAIEDGAVERFLKGHRAVLRRVRKRG
jgi:hypothetical protein